MKPIIFFILIHACTPVYAQKIPGKKHKKTEVCEQQPEYKEIIVAADEAFAAKDFEKALNNYRSALVFCPNAQYPKNKVAETETIIKSQTDAQEELQYNKIIAAADKAYIEKDYAKAKEYYQRALKMKLNDPYPMQKLKEIESILNSQKEE